jgi:V/A-type H+-transporting ATPase subunit D
MSNTAPTRSALLALREELQVTREGYQFLDEKRLLLAAETLRQLGHYEALLADFTVLQIQAAAALAEAVDRHGLDGVQTYPVAEHSGGHVKSTTRSFLGVPLQEANLALGEAATPPPGQRSPEGERARARFKALLIRTAALAAASANLHRLRLEYRRTERRARALEDVLLPELEGRIQDMSTALEELDQEEAVRARWCRVGGLRVG